MSGSRLRRAAAGRRGGGTVTGLLKYAPPTLVDPLVFNLSNTVKTATIPTDRDAIINMPTTVMETSQGGIGINGGRNVVLIGGHINHATWKQVDTPYSNRGLYIQNNVGTVHVEGLAITGMLFDAINIATDGRVVLQNIYIDGPPLGYQNGPHADVVQSWAGPSELLVDGLWAETTYQGFIIQPWDVGWSGSFTRWELNRCYIKGLAAGAISGDDWPQTYKDDGLLESNGAGYLYWQGDKGNIGAPLPTPLIGDVWGEPNPAKPTRDQWLWPKTEDWLAKYSAIQQGTPPVAFVQLGVNCGLGYVSPGYQ
jgi:hypothetical protein